MANLVTLVRVLIALFVLAVVQINPFMNLLAIALILISMLLDAVDGYIARHNQTASFAGSVYDILADRIIENVFFIYFAVFSLFSFWFAIVMLLRGLAIDAVRTLFANQGKTAFGKNTLHSNTWTQLLACSKLSRGSYNTLKLLTFICFSLLLMPQSLFFHYIDYKYLERIASLILWLTVLMSILRALPVLFEGFILNHKVFNSPNSSYPERF